MSRRLNFPTCLKDPLGYEHVELEAARCGALLFAATLLASLAALALWTSRELGEDEAWVAPERLVAQASSASSQ